MFSAEDMLAEMSAKHAVVMAGGKTRVMGWEPSDAREGVMVPKFSSVGDMTNFYANRFVQLDMREGKPVVMPLFDYWLKSHTRPTAVGFTIDSTAPMGVMPDGRFNMWRGLAVKPRPGKWPKLRYHIEQVLAAGNEEHAHYLMRWLYWVLQHPTERAEVVVVLGGLKGTGKGQMGAGVMCRIFGANSIHISDRKHLTGSFNAHLMQCCFLFVDEAFWPGDRDKDGPLKRMITEPTLTIEPKGIDAFEMKNRLSIMIAGNEDWLVPASSDERRYAVFRVSDKYRNDWNYFGPLLVEIDNGGIEAFLHEALTTDLGKWHPRYDIPQTDALKAQQQVSAPPEDLWLGALLTEGVLPFSVRDGGVMKQVVHPKHYNWARAQMLFIHATTTRKGLERWSEPRFYRFLDDHGISFKKRLAEGAYREFPPLPEMRRAWRAKHPWWPEFHDPDSDWAKPIDESIHRIAYVDAPGTLDGGAET